MAIDGLHRRFVRDFEPAERLRRKPFFLLDQPEQQMLRADVRLVKAPRLILGEHEHLARLVRKLFK